MPRQQYIEQEPPIVRRNGQPAAQSKRSVEAHEMIERTPAWLVRWGILCLIAIFGVLMLISVFVKYPDTLEGDSMITTYPLALKIKAYNGGRISHLFIQDGQTVGKNTPVAEFENNTGLYNIKALQMYTEKVAAILREGRDTELTSLGRMNLYYLNDGQSYYNQLLESIHSYILFTRQSIYSKRINILREQVKNHTDLSHIYNTEKSLANDELKQAQELFKANEELYAQKVISKAEYYAETERLNQKKALLENKRGTKIQNDILARDYTKQIFDLEYEVAEKKNMLLSAIQEAVNNTQNYIRTWKTQYLIVAPFTGTLYYSRQLQLNQTVSTSEELFSLVPAQRDYIAYLQLPPAGAGKIKKGQPVQIMLEQYPFNEYGYIEGLVNKIQVLPQQTDAAYSQPLYQVQVSLPDTLVTTYHISIPFLPEMPGKARIITKDRTLLERFISTIKKFDGR